MKFIALFAFVATVSATTTAMINYHPYAGCASPPGFKYEKCGTNILFAYGATVARITNNKEGVVFYANGDCTGNSYKVKGPVSGELCYNLEELLSFEAKCMYIAC